MFKTNGFYCTTNILWEIIMNLYRSRDQEKQIIFNTLKGVEYKVKYLREESPYHLKRVFIFTCKDKVIEFNTDGLYSTLIKLEYNLI